MRTGKSAVDSAAVVKVVAQCEAGQYADGVDCVPCPAGRFGKTPGLTSDECSGPCAVGNYSQAGWSLCLPCDPGCCRKEASTEKDASCTRPTSSSPAFAPYQASLGMLLVLMIGVFLWYTRYRERTRSSAYVNLQTPRPDGAEAEEQASVEMNPIGQSQDRTEFEQPTRAVRGRA